MVAEILVTIPWLISMIMLLIVYIKKDNKMQLPMNDGVFFKVAIVDDIAYWVHENIFYSSELDEDGDPKFSEARPIDTMSMSPSEVSKLLNILDSLKED